MKTWSILTPMIIFVQEHILSVSAILEILTNPISQNISYGELGRFFCSVRVEVHTGAIYWLMNGQPVPFSTSIAEEGFRREDSDQNLIENSTLHINGSFYKYNNLQVICGVTEHLSPIATLTINVPRRTLYLSIQSRTHSDITIGWTNPPVIVFQPGDINILFYKVTISNLQENITRNLSLNGSVSEYNFKPSKSIEYCSVLKFCITPVRSVAEIEEGRECIKIGEFAIEAPNNSSLIFQKGKYYINSSCTIICSSPSFVVWLGSGKPLHSSPNFDLTFSNDYQEFCTIEGSDGAYANTSVYKEYLGIAVTQSMTLNLSLVLITYCDNPADERCTANVCFSQSQLLQFDNIVSTPSTQYTESKAEKLNTSDVEMNMLLLGTCIVLAIILAVMCVGCVIMMFFIRKKLQYKGEQRPPLYVTRPDFIPEESFYEYCGDPTVKGESLYDKPKTPSPQPNMQPCQAYATIPVS